MKIRKKTDNPREGWEDGTPPPHRDFKERSVVLAVAHPSPYTWSTWSAVINLTSRAGELRSAPSEPDDRHRATG